MNNELYEKIEDAFINEARLVKRLNSFMYEYNHFEYDEMGINMDEADEVKARLEKIHKKLMDNVNSNLEIPLKTKDIDIVYHKVNLVATVQEDIEDEDEQIKVVQKDINFAIIVDDDGFELEIEKEQDDEKEQITTDTEDTVS